jgi:hypothetical protein
VLHNVAAWHGCVDAGHAQAFVVNADQPLLLKPVAIYSYLLGLSHNYS